MRVLIDLKHPADVLLFKDVAARLTEEGHEVLICSRDKDETVELLAGLGIGHVCLSRMGRGALGLAAELARRVFRLRQVARGFRPHVMVARTGICIAIVGRLLGIPSVVVDDTEFAWLQIRLCEPLATVMCTGLGYGRRFPGKQLQFGAPTQLAYTHPARFRPDPNLLRYRGIEPDEPYVVLRLKEWRASHDWGVEGPGIRQMASLVGQLRDFARPVISSERPLPADLASYASPLPPEDALHLLYFARLYVGEGSSMAAEAACLGTPAIFLSPASRRGYLDAMERLYGHVTTVQAPWQAEAVARKWLADPLLREHGREAARRLVAESEDPVDFLLDVIHRYGAKG
jgi:predicted glycosyltransferase